MSPKSWEAALTAVGAANAAVDDVFEGRADNVFVAARPPGHHAERLTAMGFCLFNNAAIAARHAQRRHGAERSPSSIGTSTTATARRTFSGTIRPCSTARPTRCRFIRAPAPRARQGVGNIVNAPLTPNTGSDLFRDAFLSRVLPAIDTFRRT
jgi:acetoin utilization deacetylase AcuC-like enzyme